MRHHHVSADRRVSREGEAEPKVIGLVGLEEACTLCNKDNITCTSNEKAQCGLSAPCLVWTSIHAT